MWLLSRCIVSVLRLQSQPITTPENILSDQTLEKIEQELRLMNVNLAEANDIAMLSAFKTMPADLDDGSRKAMRRLRDKMMERSRIRADI
jgi:hypothetical protein